MIPRRKEPMANLIRELRIHNAHQEAIAAGRVMPVEQDEEDETDDSRTPRLVGVVPRRSTALEEPGRSPGHPGRFTYSLVTDDRQTGWYDPGVGVRCDQTGVLMNEEPFDSDRKAQEFLDDLENPEGE